jgi:3-oxoacyl-[acyl-carrier-protein] synthase II
MKYFIKTAASITHQNSFDQENLWKILTPLSEEHSLQAPDYKVYISPASLRRLSPVLRMGIALAKQCQARIKEEIDAISVGTALGCLADTEKFLVNILAATSDTLSPTAFIQSTHNTIAGQISLELGNHSYNMTHTQNALSFEMALIDAMLCCGDGKQATLVGAADEAIEFLKILQPFVIQDQFPLTSGATLFVLGEKEHTGVCFVDCALMLQNENTEDIIFRFLQKNQLSDHDIDCAFYAGTKTTLNFRESMEFLQYTGLYYSASAFATHMAHDWLIKQGKKYALVINNVCGNQLGLTLLARE